MVVAIASVLAYPAAEQLVGSETPVAFATLEEELSDPIEIEVSDGLVRDKRQWGGGYGEFLM